jgi:SAM-dependent methyltransferase
LTHKSILDCGCGNARAYNILKNFNFKKYIGVDIDINMLGKVTNMDKNMMVSYYNLAKEDNYWYNIKEDNFNLILAINSIMHFCTDYFWETINSITQDESYMIVSLVDNIDSYHFDEYYIKKIDNMVYYKFPIHEEERSEIFIDKDVFIKNGWEICYTYKTNYNNLSDCYTWYILKINRSKF